MALHLSIRKESFKEAVVPRVDNSKNDGPTFTFSTIALHFAYGLTANRMKMKLYNERSLVSTPTILFSFSQTYYRSTERRDSKLYIMFYCSACFLFIMHLCLSHQKISQLWEVASNQYEDTPKGL